MCDRDESVADRQLSGSGCKVEYAALESCLTQNQRDWTKCQDVLKTFQLCFKHSKDQDQQARKVDSRTH